MNALARLAAAATKLREVPLRAWPGRAIGSVVLQVLAALALARAAFEVLFRYAPLKLHGYREPVLATQHLHLDALVFLAPFVLVGVVASRFTALRALVPGSRRFASTIVALGAVLVAGVLAASSPLKGTQMFEPILVADLLRRDAVTLFVVCSVGVVLASARATSWSGIDPRKRARLLVMVCATVLVWAFATLETNLYFGRDYDVDRLLLLGALAALWIHPAGVFPFLAILVTLAAQGHRPLPEGTWMWPDKMLPVAALCVLAGYLWIRALLRDRTRPELLPFGVLCLIGASYAHSAFNKALLGPSLGTWLFENDMSNLFVSSYAHGRWLGHWPEERVLAVAAVLHELRVPLALGGFGIEFAGTFLGSSWRVARTLLPVFVALHAGILAMSGILFWKWILVDLAFLYYLSRLRRDGRELSDPSASARADIFRPLLAVVSVVVIVLGPLFFFQSKFAWFDTRLVNRFEIIGVGVSGERYPVDPRFFAPYDLVMQQSRHGYSVSFPMLVGTYGTMNDWSRRCELEGATPEDVAALRARLEAEPAPAPPSEVLFDFVRTSMNEAQRRGTRDSFRTVLAPPYHFGTTPLPGHYDFQERLAAVEIRYVETLNTGEALVRTKDVEVRTIELDP